MSLRRVHPGEWAAATCGALVLVGLFLPWSGDDTGLQSLSVLKLILLGMSIAAILLPVVVAVSSKTDVPIIWETFLSNVAVISAFVLAIRLVWQLGDGLRVGFFLALAGSAALVVAGWHSVARQD